MEVHAAAPDKPEDKMPKMIRFALFVSTFLGSGFAAQAATLAALSKYPLALVKPSSVSTPPKSQK